MSGGVGGVSGSGQVQAMPTVSGGNLSADAVMLYCATQLNHLDDGIKEKMAKQEAKRDPQNKLGALKDTLGGNSLPADAFQRKEDIINAMRAAYKSLPEGDPGRDRLNRTFHEFMQNACNSNGKTPRGDENLWNLTDQQVHGIATRADYGGNDASADELKGYAATVDGILGDLGKGAELEMINLQSMVSQRQMVVQVTTQLIAKMNETAMAVANSIGK
jgi:hypothetical protein